MTSKKKVRYVIRLREGLPYKSRKIKDGDKTVTMKNEYGPTPFGIGRIDEGVEVSKKTYDHLQERDDTKREHGGTPEFEFRILKGGEN